MTEGEVVEMFCQPPPIGCGKKVESPSDFRDRLSLREFFISGLCQSCQDEVFADPDDVDE